MGDRERAPAWLGHQNSSQCIGSVISEDELDAAEAPVAATALGAEEDDGAGDEDGRART